MNKQEINQILKLNKQFYQLIAADFSETRQKPWEGWSRVVDLINEKRGETDQNTKDRIKILDLGCGNGRFFKLLREKSNNFEYIGIDINNDLLNEVKKLKGKSKTQLGKFIKEDIFKNLEKIPGKYNVVTVFGITHHIPDEKFREKWFLNILKFLEESPTSFSLIALSFWDFAKEPGDYLLGWKNNKDVSRFCHKYSQKELNSIKNRYEKFGLKLIESYESDNKNLYMVFGRI